MASDLTNDKYILQSERMPSLVIFLGMYHMRGSLKAYSLLSSRGGRDTEPMPGPSPATVRTLRSPSRINTAASWPPL